jgi:hypothetical protein
MREMRGIDESARRRVLRSVSDLRRVTIAATDGELGSVRDLYFDDLSWRVRYLLVDTDSWLPDHRILVSPTSVRRWDPNPSTLRVALTKTQFKTCVDMNTQRAVVDQAISGYIRESREPHLQAATTVLGYVLETEDGEIGHVEDLLVDDTAWVIRYLLVDTKDRWAGQSVLVAPEWLTEVSRDGSRRFFSIVTAIDEGAASRRTAIPTPTHHHSRSLRSSIRGATASRR